MTSVTIIATFQGGETGAGAGAQAEAVTVRQDNGQGS